MKYNHLFRKQLVIIWLTIKYKHCWQDLLMDKLFDRYWRKNTLYNEMPNILDRTKFTLQLTKVNKAIE